jgi:hypothetical protein
MGLNECDKDPLAGQLVALGVHEMLWDEKRNEWRWGACGH